MTLLEHSPHNLKTDFFTARSTTTDVYHIRKGATGGSVLCGAKTVLDGSYRLPDVTLQEVLRNGENLYCSKCITALTVLL